MICPERAKTAVLVAWSWLLSWRLCLRNRVWWKRPWWCPVSCDRPCIRYPANKRRNLETGAVIWCLLHRHRRCQCSWWPYDVLPTAWRIDFLMQAAFLTVEPQIAACCWHFRISAHSMLSADPPCAPCSRLPCPRRPIGTCSKRQTEKVGSWSSVSIINNAMDESLSWQWRNRGLDFYLFR